MASSTKVSRTYEKNNLQSSDGEHSAYSQAQRESRSRGDLEDIRSQLKSSRVKERSNPESQDHRTSRNHTSHRFQQDDICVSSDVDGGSQSRLRHSGHRQGPGEKHRSEDRLERTPRKKMIRGRQPLSDLSPLGRSKDLLSSPRPHASKSKKVEIDAEQWKKYQAYQEMQTRREKRRQQVQSQTKRQRSPTVTGDDESDVIAPTFGVGRNTAKRAKLGISTATPTVTKSSNRDSLKLGIWEELDSPIRLNRETRNRSIPFVPLSTPPKKNSVGHRSNKKEKRLGDDSERENREPEYDPIESDSPNPASRSVNPDPPLVASLDNEDRNDMMEGSSRRVMTRKTRLPSKFADDNNIEREKKLLTMTSRAQKDVIKDSEDEKYETLPSDFPSNFSKRLGPYNVLPILRKSCEVPEDSSYQVVTIGFEAWSENAEIKKNINITALVEVIKTPGSTNGYLMNPARSNPDKLRYVTNPYRGIARKNLDVQHFITYGSATLSNLVQAAVTTGNKTVKSIAIEPLIGEWERGIAFYGTVCQQNYLGTRVWKNAVSFGTRFDGPNKTAGGSSGKYKNKAQSLMGSKQGGERVLSSMDEIPVWDARPMLKGRRNSKDPRFDFDNYKNLPLYKSEVPKGSLVGVIHTTEFMDSGTRGPAKLRVVFNIKEVIIFAIGQLSEEEEDEDIHADN